MNQPINNFRKIKRATLKPSPLKVALREGQNPSIHVHFTLKQAKNASLKKQSAEIFTEGYRKHLRETVEQAENLNDEQLNVLIAYIELRRAGLDKQDVFELLMGLTR